MRRAVLEGYSVDIVLIIARCGAPTKSDAYMDIQPLPLWPGRREVSTQAGDRSFRFPNLTRAGGPGSMGADTEKDAARKRRDDRDARQDHVVGQRAVDDDDEHRHQVGATAGSAHAARRPAAGRDCSNAGPFRAYSGESPAANSQAHGCRDDRSGDPGGDPQRRHRGLTRSRK